MTQGGHFNMIKLLQLSLSHQIVFNMDKQTLLTDSKGTFKYETTKMCTFKHDPAGIFFT
jgi:hypothetical protein